MELQHVEAPGLEIKNEEEILARRERMKGNPELLEVISMFWAILSYNSKDGEVIYKDQFVHFLYLLQSAILGPRNVCEHEAGSSGELEFIHNVGYYGECSAFAFNDIMTECIECWSDVESPTFYPAFAWTLFCSIVNVNEKIPCFIDQKKIKRIYSGNNAESVMSVQYFKDKALRAKMLKVVQWAKQNARVDNATKKRMQGRRKGQTFSADKSQELHDIFTIHQHQLDMEAACQMAISKGRISPAVRNRQNFTRAFSRTFSRTNTSDNIQDLASIDDEDTSNTPTKSASSAKSVYKQENVFKRTKSKTLLVNTAMDNMNNISPVPSGISPLSFISATPKNVFVEEERSHKDKFTEKVPKSNVEEKLLDARVDQQSVDIAPVPKARKKRDIVVIKNDAIANKMKLDPSELSGDELKNLAANQNVVAPTTPFCSDVPVIDDDVQSWTSHGRAALSRQNSQAGSVLQRQNSAGRVLSRQNSAAKSVGTPPQALSRQASRTPISRTTSSVTNIQFDGETSQDEENYFKNYVYEEQNEPTVETVVEPEKTIAVRKLRTIQPPTEDSGVCDIGTVQQGGEKHKIFVKHNQPTRVENVVSSQGESFPDLNNSNMNEGKHSGVENDDGNDHDGDDDYDNAYANALDHKNASYKRNDRLRVQNVLPSDEPKSGSNSQSHHVEGNEDISVDESNGEVTHADNSSILSEGDHDDVSNADYISRLSAEGYGSHDDDSLTGCLSINPSERLVCDLSVGPSVDPGSLSKYDHHLELENVENSVAQYVMELPENTLALPSRMAPKKQVRHVVHMTPKMNVAKGVAQKKQNLKKIYQSSLYVKETRILSSYSKTRGQTPMQRKFAASSTVPDAPGKYFVPAQNLETSAKFNIKHLMNMVVKNNKLKSEARKAGLDSIALDMAELKQLQQSNNMMLETTCHSPESNHNEDESVISHVLFPHNNTDKENEEKSQRKILDLFYMKKGLIRCSYLHLVNADGQPEFIYISKREPNSMSKRFSKGSTLLTEWDKYLIAFVRIIDNHISSVAKKTDTVTLKSLMSELMYMHSPCSKVHRLQRLSLEFNVVNIGKELDELHILGEIYKKREKLHKEVMKDTADILQKDIDVKFQKSTVDPPTEGSESKSLPMIDDSHTFRTVTVSSIEGSCSSSQRPFAKSRKKWMKKLHDNLDHQYTELSVAGSSKHSRVSKSSQGLRGHGRPKRASFNNVYDNDSVISDVSGPIRERRPIVDGSVAFSSSQPSLHSHSSGALNPFYKMENSFQNPSTIDDCPLQTNQIFSSSRPNTASLATYNMLSFHHEHSPSCDDSIYYHNDSPHIPWVPQGGMKLMVSDKIDIYGGWRDRCDAGKYVDTTRSNSILKRTGLIRDSFESFTKTNPDYEPTNSVEFFQTK